MELFIEHSVFFLCLIFFCNWCFCPDHIQYSRHTAILAASGVLLPGTVLHFCLEQSAVISRKIQKARKKRILERKKKGGGGWVGSGMNSEKKLFLNKDVTSTFFSCFFPREGARQKSCSFFSLLFVWLVLLTSYRAVTQLRTEMIWNFDKRKDQGGQIHRLPRKVTEFPFWEILKTTRHSPGQSDLINSV